MTNTFAPNIIIGDIHGKVDKYWELLQKLDNTDSSIQVGDFGFHEHHTWHNKNIDPTKHKVNFGNHDDYTHLDRPHSLGNWSITANGIMTVRGAFSIDKAKRTPFIDWWPNEEISYMELCDIADIQLANRPKVMVTHDCPHEVMESLFGISDKTMTGNGLQIMFENHQPELWVFGHYHKHRNEVINGTRFICLPEFEILKL